MNRTKPSAGTADLPSLLPPDLEKISTKQLMKYKTCCTVCKHCPGVTYCFDCQRVFCSSCWEKIALHTANLPSNVTVASPTQTGLHFSFHPPSTVSLGEVVLATDGATIGSNTDQGSKSEIFEEDSGFTSNTINSLAGRMLENDCQSTSISPATDASLMPSNFAKYVENKRHQQKTKTLITYHQSSTNKVKNPKTPKGNFRHPTTSPASEKPQTAMTDSFAVSVPIINSTQFKSTCFHNDIVESVKQSMYMGNYDGFNDINSENINEDDSTSTVVYIRPIVREMSHPSDIMINEGVPISLTDAVANQVDHWPLSKMPVSRDDVDVSLVRNKNQFSRSYPSSSKNRTRPKVVGNNMLVPLERNFTAPTIKTEPLELNISSFNLKSNSSVELVKDLRGSNVNIEDSQYKKYVKVKTSMIHMKLDRSKHTVLPFEDQTENLTLTKSTSQSSPFATIDKRKKLPVTLINILPFEPLKQLV